MPSITHLLTDLPEPAVASNGKYAPPEWLHLIPAGPFRGKDGRGPFVVRDAADLVRVSLHGAGGKLLLDENHVTDYGGPLGARAPAVAWLTELEVRDDGIWGKANWTKHGQALMADEAYRGLSPVIVSERDAQGREVVTRLLRASLTNVPNFTLTNLHSQQENAGMDLAKIRTALGLPVDAAESVVEQTIIDRATASVSLHSQVAEVAGVDRGTAADALVTALRARLGAANAGVEQLTTLQTEVKTLKQQIATGEATRVVDEAATRKPITPELRGQLISLHSTNPDMVKTIIGTLPDLTTGSLSLHNANQPKTSLSEDERKAAEGLGVKPESLTTKGAV